MNWVDFLLIAIIVLSVYNGWNRGFLLGSLELLGWLGSVCFGFAFYPFASAFLQQYFPSLGLWILPLSFIFTIIIARLILSLIINAILSATTARMHHSSINHAAGMVPGL